MSDFIMDKLVPPMIVIMCAFIVLAAGHACASEWFGSHAGIRVQGQCVRCVPCEGDLSR